MKRALMYGAGNIGRGFIGKALSESGYAVTFVDIIPSVIQQLNQDRCYPVNIVTSESNEPVVVENVQAINGLDVDAVAETISKSDIMATAVGVKIMPKIIKPICEGLKRRKKTAAAPLNIIICENLLNADQYMKGLIRQELGSKYEEWLENSLGLVEASIGRMVPVMTPEMRGNNDLRVWVEPYDELPVDKDAFKGEIPQINNLVPYSPFGFYIKRKLFIHNMGHAMCAYMGWHKGYKSIAECVNDDKAIYTQAGAAMRDVAAALSKEYGISYVELEEHIADLLFRFSNQALGDTVVRVGRDPIRKLGRNDRLIGAAEYCITQGCSPKKYYTRNCCSIEVCTSRGCGRGGTTKSDLNKRESRTS